jgi:uncharacterized peroxidase-related enzyme
LYLKTVSAEDATGELAEIYSADTASMGMVMEATSCWSARPDIAAPVDRLLHQIRDGFSLGLVNFRLITLIAARHVPSSYCSHVYFKSLSKVLGRDKVLAIQRDFRAAGLEPREVAMLAYAEQISIDASRITAADIDALRVHGFTDLNIADIALAASFRNFLSRYFDAVGATVEAAFLDEDPQVQAQLAVGK